LRFIHKDLQEKEKKVQIRKALWCKYRIQVQAQIQSFRCESK